MLLVSHITGEISAGWSRIGPQKKLFWNNRKWQAAGENCIIRSFLIFTPRRIVLRVITQGSWDWRGTWHVWKGKNNGYRLLTWQPKVKETTWKTCVIWECNIRMKWRGSAWKGFIWLMIERGGECNNKHTGVPKKILWFYSANWETPRFSMKILFHGVSCLQFMFCIVKF